MEGGPLWSGSAWPVLCEELPFLEDTGPYLASSSPTDSDPWGPQVPKGLSARIASSLDVQAEMALCLCPSARPPPVLPH